MNRKTRALLVAGASLSTPALAQAPTPPVAATKPHQVTAPFGAAREDEYYWLRDDSRKNPEMLGFLNAENAYADAVLARSKPLAETLTREITGRIKQDDSSVPYRERGYWYYTRFETGADYPIVARRKGEMTAPEEILLDQPAMAKGAGFFAVSGWAVSPDNRLLAWAEDRVGRRQYRVKVKNLQTGEILKDEIANAEPDFVWADDNRTLFYVEKDPTTLLSKRVKKHVLGATGADPLVYEETDDSFYMGLGRTTSDRFICIGLQSTVSNEYRCAPAADPARFVPIAPRERSIRYNADHQGGRWFIRTDWQAPNYRLMTVADADMAKGRTAWRDLVPASAESFIQDFKPFAGFVAIEERSGGNKRLRLLSDGGASSLVAFDEPAFTMALGQNAEPNSLWVRYTYSSLVTPTTTIEVNSKTGERRVLKVQPVPGYEPSNYVTERVWIDARDGTKVPVSLVYRKGLKKDGTAALYQYGYGSSTARARSCFRHTARTASRWTRHSVRSCPACSTAASSMRSPISGAGRKWDAPGGRTASSARRRTASPTLST